VNKLEEADNFFGERKETTTFKRGAGAIGPWSVIERVNQVPPRASAPHAPSHGPQTAPGAIAAFYIARR
jgi:hypothetical protein